MLEKVDLATEIYNKFQSEYYLLSSAYSDNKIMDLEINIMLLQYNKKLINEA